MVGDLERVPTVLFNYERTAPSVVNRGRESVQTVRFTLSYILYDLL